MIESNKNYMRKILNRNTYFRFAATAAGTALLSFIIRLSGCQCGFGGGHVLLRCTVVGSRIGIGATVVRVDVRGFQFLLVRIAAHAVQFVFVLPLLLFVSLFLFLL